MSDPTLERPSPLELGDFAHPKEVEDIIRETVSVRELSEILDLDLFSTTNIVSKRQMHFVSRVAPPGSARRFPAMDIWGASIFAGFERLIKPSRRKTLADSLLTVTFGDPVSNEEFQERRAAFAKGKSPGPFAYRLHEQRRDELLADPWSAMPLWWSRSLTKQFFMLLKEDGNILTGLADRDIPESGHLPIPLLQSMRIRSTLNVTQWLGQVDKKIAAVIADRAG